MTKQRFWYSKWLEYLVDFFCLSFVLLFMYTGASKLSGFGAFQRAIHAQPLAGWIQWLVTYTIPPLELLIALLIIISRTRILGVAAFTLLMVLFTGYTGLVKANYYGKQPCSCGGVFNNLTWGEHLTVNILFLSAAFITYWLLVKLKKTPFESKESLRFA